MSRCTIISSNRRGGKTHTALKLARADGRPFAVLVGDPLFRHEHWSRHYRACPAATGADAATTAPCAHQCRSEGHVGKSHGIQEGRSELP